MAHWRALRFDFTALGGPCSLQLEGTDERSLRRAARAAMDEVARIEHKFSRYRASSVVGRINAAAGAAPVPVDAETQSLLSYADTLYLESDGLFDITSGILRQCWDFKHSVLPKQEQIEALLPRIGWPLVQRHGGAVRLPQAGMEIDLGGIGKEYAADRAAVVLAEAGVAHALVNLGGDLHALGPHGLPSQGGQGWDVTIAHPRARIDGAPAVLARWPLQRGGLTTSGDYARYLVHDGQRYSHILNPRTGWPVRHWQSISVQAPNALAAGATCTVAMLKQDQALDWLSAQGLAYLAVRHDGAVFQGPPESFPLSIHINTLNEEPHATELA